MFSRTSITSAILLTGAALLFSCSKPFVHTDPVSISDTGRVTISCNAAYGNKGLMDFQGPVFVHLGLITDSSEFQNEWRYVKFKWGSTEPEALAIPRGRNKWTYTIPNLREFFAVAANEKVLKLAVLFREGNCVDTLCRVLRNEDKSDIYIDINHK